MKKKKIKILMMTFWDWANTGYRFRQCLEILNTIPIPGVQVEVIQFKGAEHNFHYPEQAKVNKALAGATHLCVHPLIVYTHDQGIQRLMDMADIIYFTASTLVLTPYGLPKGVPIVVQHGGTTYRVNPESCNRVFNPIVSDTIIQCPDLLNLGAKNEHLIYYPINTQFVKTSDINFRDNDKLVIGHWPSTPSVKGTSVILKVINKLSNHPKYKDKFIYIGTREEEKQEHLPWEEHLKRVDSCDILIETINAELGGKSFGEWGNQALEGSALNKIVITNSTHEEEYFKNYGESIRKHLRIANNEEELTEVLSSILEFNRDRAHLLNLKMNARKWADQFHGMESTSVRLYNEVFCKLFNQILKTRA